ncbi:NAD-dependent epimerase/dehydratase family protein [Nocardia brasiliensis]|uniref:NAD-dependent epimerase/dehydratase family protein n=1 Tax=Nocardia brasiliensis TaxID=37326 RepID=UPI00142D2131|nr:NAD(P)-dependent oxidoreductase [Nocardia brasiliensis]
MTRTAVVIGGSGYLGRGIGEFLAAHGWRVVPVGRAEFDVAAAPIAALTELLSGAELVVNAAGALWQVSDAQMVTANTVLMQRLLDAVTALPRPAMVVQLGSVYEYGSGHGGTVDESTPPRPETAYGRTKLAATEALRRWPGDGVVLRCSTVIGARAPRAGLLGSIAHRLAELSVEDAVPRVLELPALRGSVDVLDLRDLGAAVLAAANAPAAAADAAVVNIASGAAVPVEFAVHRLIELSGVAVRLVGVGGAGSPRAAAGAPPISIERAYRRLGWAPRFALDDTLRALWRYTSEARTGASNT